MNFIIASLEDDDMRPIEANSEDLASVDTITTATMVKRGVATMKLRLAGKRADDRPFDETIVLSDRQVGILIDAIQEGRMNLRINCMRLDLDLL